MVGAAPPRSLAGGIGRWDPGGPRRSVVRGRGPVLADDDARRRAGAPRGSPARSSRASSASTLASGRRPRVGRARGAGIAVAPGLGSVVGARLGRRRSIASTRPRRHEADLARRERRLQHLDRRRLGVGRRRPGRARRADLAADEQGRRAHPGRRRPCRHGLRRRARLGDQPPRQRRSTAIDLRTNTSTRLALVRRRRARAHRLLDGSALGHRPRRRLLEVDPADGCVAAHDRHRRSGSTSSRPATPSGSRSARQRSTDRLSDDDALQPRHTGGRGHDRRRRRPAGSTSTGSPPRPGRSGSPTTRAAFSTGFPRSRGAKVPRWRGAGPSSSATPRGRTRPRSPAAASLGGCATRSRARRRALTEQIAVTAFDPGRLRLVGAARGGAARRRRRREGDRRARPAPRGARRIAGDLRRRSAEEIAALFGAAADARPRRRARR